MNTYLIQDWTNPLAVVNGCAPQDLRYRIYRQGSKLFQDIHDKHGERLHAFELPDGISLARNSYEVLLRYALTDVIAA